MLTNTNVLYLCVISVSNGIRSYTTSVTAENLFFRQIQRVLHVNNKRLPAFTIPILVKCCLIDAISIYQTRRRSSNRKHLRRECLRVCHRLSSANLKMVSKVVKDGGEDGRQQSRCFIHKRVKDRSCNASPSSVSVCYLGLSPCELLPSRAGGNILFSMLQKLSSVLGFTAPKKKNGNKERKKSGTVNLQSTNTVIMNVFTRE